MVKIKTKNLWLFWLIFLSFLSFALIFQSSFLPLGERYKFIPYLTLPAVVFFFLHHNNMSSLWLLLFMSFLSSAFSPLPFSATFFLYLLCLLTVFLIKNFFFFKSSFLFFILAFTVSLLFPYFVDLTYDLSIDDFSVSTGLNHFVKAISTLVLSFMLFPFLRKYLQERTGF